jgi:hypothetical protein
MSVKQVASRAVFATCFNLVSCLSFSSTKKMEMKFSSEMLFSLKKQKDPGGKEHYQIKISNELPALNNLDNNVDINSISFIFLTCP